MNKITEPLRLAVGSHTAGSGKGCAMNVVSWENGDTEITDLPDCADPMLARLVQSVNDRYCTHRDGDLLCPDCSVRVLGLAHRVAGTSAHGLDDEALKRAWVTIAVEQAESVARDGEDQWVTEARAAVRGWLAGYVDASGVAYAAAYAAAAHAAYADAHAYAAAATAAYAAADVDAAYAAYAAAAYAAYAAAAEAVAYAASAAGVDRVEHAHRVVDRFYELTGLTEGWEPKVPADLAVASMLEVSA